MVLCIDSNQVLSCYVQVNQHDVKWSAHKLLHQHLVKNGSKRGKNRNNSAYFRDCELCHSTLFKRTRACIIAGKVYITAPTEKLSTWTQQNGRRMSLRSKPTWPTFEKRFNDVLSYVITVDRINKDTQNNRSTRIHLSKKEKELKSKIESFETNVSDKESVVSVPSVSNETSLLNSKTVRYDTADRKKMKRKKLNEKRKASVRQPTFFDSESQAKSKW